MTNNINETIANNIANDIEDAEDTEFNEWAENRCRQFEAEEEFRHDCGEYSGPIS